MSLQVAKWGNSLAVRLPAALVKQAGWTAGDEIEVTLTPTGELILKPAVVPQASNVRSGLGLLAKVARQSIDDDDDAKLLQAVRDQDRMTHS